MVMVAGDVPQGRGSLVGTTHPAHRRAGHHSMSGPSDTSGGQCPSAGSRGSNGR